MEWTWRGKKWVDLGKRTAHLFLAVLKGRHWKHLLLHSYLKLNYPILFVFYNITIRQPIPHISLFFFQSLTKPLSDGSLKMYFNSYEREHWFTVDLVDVIIINEHSIETGIDNNRGKVCDVMTIEKWNKEEKVCGVTCFAILVD